MLHRLGLAIIPAIVLGVLLVTAGPAWATIDNVKTYKQAYPGKEPKAYTCKACHEGAVGKKGDLNAFGQALQQFKAPADAMKLTAEDFQAFDKADADGDGICNGDELTAGTDPADPASVPAGAAAPEGATEEQKTEGAGESPAPHSELGVEKLRQLRAYFDQWLTPDAEASTGPESAEEADTPQPEYVGTETCASCHDKEFQEFSHSTHARISIPGETLKVQGCEMCHGPGSLHVEAGGGRGVGGIINPRKDPSTCFQCHMDKRAQFRLPYRHPVMEGKMSCADCHNAHAPDVKPWSATSLKDINEACFKCHKEQRGPFVWEHEALREGCTTCHQVHGSINQKMLVARDNNLCLRCHAQVNFPQVGNSSHSSRFREATCFSGGCHTAPHGSNFSDHLRY